MDIRILDILSAKEIVGILTKEFPQLIDNIPGSVIKKTGKINNSALARNLGITQEEAKTLMTKLHQRLLELTNDSTRIQ